MTSINIFKNVLVKVILAELKNTFFFQRKLLKRFKMCFMVKHKISTFSEYILNWFEKTRKKMFKQIFSPFPLSQIGQKWTDEDDSCIEYSCQTTFFGNAIVEETNHQRKCPKCAAGEKSMPPPCKNV